MFKPWFKLNKWKTGWIPISWQGWLLTIGFIGMTMYNFFRIHQSSQSIFDTLLIFIPQTLIFAGLFSTLCYFRSERSSGEEMLQ